MDRSPLRAYFTSGQSTVRFSSTEARAATIFINADSRLRERAGMPLEQWRLKRDRKRSAHLLHAVTHLLDVRSGLCGELLDVIEQCVCRLEHAAMPVLSLLVGENVEAGSLEVGAVIVDLRRTSLRL